MCSNRWRLPLQDKEHQRILREAIRKLSLPNNHPPYRLNGIASQGVVVCAQAFGRRIVFRSPHHGVDQLAFNPSHVQRSAG